MCWMIEGLCRWNWVKGVARFHFCHWVKRFHFCQVILNPATSPAPVPLICGTSHLRLFHLHLFQWSLIGGIFRRTGVSPSPSFLSRARTHRQGATSTLPWWLWRSIQRWAMRVSSSTCSATPTMGVWTTPPMERSISNPTIWEMLNVVKSSSANYVSCDTDTQSFIK